MATKAIPTSIDPTGSREVFPELATLVAAAKPGDDWHAPDNAIYRCDKPLPFATPGVKWHWNGATFKQTSTRPYGATITGCSIVNGKHVDTPTQIPAAVNWGYVRGPGIPAGTHIVLDGGRKGGTLDRLCKDGTGLTLIFTSKLDRGRCGFRISARDFEHHDAKWFGPSLDPVFTPFELEAQHGVDLAGATDGLLSGIEAHNMYGDGIYYGATGSRRTTGVEAEGGQIINVARSALVAPHAIDCTVRKYTIDRIGRTVLNFEPPSAECWTERFALTDSILGTHGLTLMSSGGTIAAHVGAVDLSRNCITKGAMILWLIVGNPTHKRGPYTIEGNFCSSKSSHGGTYPTRALICIANAHGAKVVDNKGILLQPGRGMAVVRAMPGIPLEVHGNEQTGGIETGPWV